MLMQTPDSTAPHENPQLQSEVRLLGLELQAQSASVLERTIARNTDSGFELSGVVEERFKRIGEISTAAVAAWMAGASVQEAVTVGEEVWAIFGQLAAQRAAPLAEVTKRVWRWHDVAHELLGETAAQKNLSAQALTYAYEMLETTLRLTIVRMCDSFDAERSRVDEELEQRQDELTHMATHDTLTGLPTGR
jgi:hypothetical protein